GGTVGDEHLGAVEHVVIAVAHRASADGRHVAAAAGLGDRDGREQLTPAHRRQVLRLDRKSTRLNSSHGSIAYAVLCLKKKRHNGCTRGFCERYKLAYPRADRCFVTTADTPRIRNFFSIS